MLLQISDHMTKAEFKVGKKEMHTVTVEATSAFVRKLKIAVDGHEIANTLWSKWSGGATTFSVGNKEQHQVEVRVSGYFTPKISLLVDGKMEGGTR